MAYDKTNWEARQGVNLNKFTKQQETSNSVILTNTPDEITTPGTPFSADNMNKIEQGIADAHELVENASSAILQEVENYINNAIDNSEQTSSFGPYSNIYFGFQNINGETNTTSNLDLEVEFNIPIYGAAELLAHIQKKVLRVKGTVIGVASTSANTFYSDSNLSPYRVEMKILDPLFTNKKVAIAPGFHLIMVYCLS